jgi:hypothetical protein
MNARAALVYRHTWRLVLTVAPGNEDARRDLTHEIGPDPTAWYFIANMLAFEVTHLLDIEYLSETVLDAFDDTLGPEDEQETNELIAADRDTAPGNLNNIRFEAREYAIGVIERRLADVLDTSPTTEQE